MTPIGDRASARDIPSIERLRQLPRARALEDMFGRDAVLDALRAEAATLRASLASPDAIKGDSAHATMPRVDASGSGISPAGSTFPSTDVDADAVAHAIVGTGTVADRILDRAEARLERLFRSRLRSVINATGVILHTNLGRAPLADAALARIAEIGASYASLEYDLERGTRGRRDVHAEPLLCHLSGPNAQAAIVVNNNAAAVLLMLSALAQGREVIISRGELIEIGGGFRVPDVMRQSGATLREVGTTNRTRAADYAAAISDRTALILRVHPSNFVIEGFSARPSLAELTAIGRQFNVPVAEDLGSGFFEDAASTAPLTDEPTVQASLRAGTDVVAFSGDKLLGGPQAGILAGRRDLIDKMRHHPLMRALRVDKLTYAALEATLVEHARGHAAETVPVIRMLSLKVDEIDARATSIVRQLTDAAGTAAESVRVDIIDGFSAIGGGSAPGERLPTRLLAIDASASASALSPDALLTRLREHDPPVIARIEQDRVIFDLRTVPPAQDVTLASAIRWCLNDRA